MDYSTLFILDCKTTVWEHKSHQPAGQVSEIINIDVAVVDTVKNQITEHEKIYIKPVKSKVSEYCEKSFGIKQSQLDEDGLSFQEAYRRLRIYYMSKDRLWASWGNYERIILDKQCKSFELETLLSYQGHDIQHLFCLMTGNESPTINYALTYTETAPNSNTAVNIANIFIKMAKGLRPVVKNRIVVPAQFNRAN